jgi:asparagine synthase (glutamine-hydrolysing)
MCGINGLIGSGNLSAAREKVSVMNAAMAHRGPDSDGVWAIDGVAFGHRRLSIIDTSDAGRQPFFSEDGNLVIAFNGEVYNYVELRNELAARHTFRSGTDTEVILAAYREWGIECIHRFIGMFAFALWDIQRSEGYLVRDRLGIKPLYISDTPQGFYFASELRSILSTGAVPRKINRIALADYLRYQTVHAPRTIAEGVEMLAAGHYMHFTAGSHQTIRYWDAASDAVHYSGQERSAVLKEVKDRLLSSVELRMRADVPFGAFLSGGIDSSIIVGLMAGVSAHPVDTFSVTFDEKQWDESPYSELIAQKFNTRHHPIPLRAVDFLTQLPDALMAMDHPSGDGPNTYVVAGVTRRQGVKMALSGLGGDEVFAGYPVFTQMKKMEGRQWIGHAPKAMRALAGKALLAVKPSVASEKISALLSEDAVDFAHGYPLSRRVFLEDKVRNLLSYDPGADDAVKEAARRIAVSSLPLLSKVSVAEMTTYMQHVLLRDADQMSMAHALEVRVPFLDHRLVEYVLGIPDAIKYPHTPKQLLTDAVGDLIPGDIIHRPKMGFTFPWEVWMKNELRSFCQENLDYLGSLSHFRPGAIADVWKQFMSGNPQVSWSRVWPLVVLGHWCKTQGMQ